MGMFRQPLLNGATESQLLLAKVFSVLMIALVCFLVQIVFSIGCWLLVLGKSCIWEYAGGRSANIVTLCSTDNNSIFLCIFIALYVKYIQYDVCFTDYSAD